jgi:hypothetical protein
VNQKLFVALGEGEARMLVIVRRAAALILPVAEPPRMKRFDEWLKVHRL